MECGDRLDWPRGVTIRPRLDGNLEVSPRRLLTDETRRLIREHKAELLQALAVDPLPDPAAETRRQRVLTMLEAYPEACYGAVSDSEAIPGFVLLTLAIRDLATVDLLIPAAKWDGVLFFDLLERHGGTVH